MKFLNTIPIAVIGCLGLASSVRAEIKKKPSLFRRTMLVQLVQVLCVNLAVMVSHSRQSQ